MTRKDFFGIVAAELIKREQKVGPYFPTANLVAAVPVYKLVADALGLKEPKSELELAQERIKHLETKQKEILKYCQNETHLMWAAKIVSIALDCDFRDAEYELEKFRAKVPCE